MSEATLLLLILCWLVGFSLMVIALFAYLMRRYDDEHARRLEAEKNTETARRVALETMVAAVKRVEETWANPPPSSL